MKTMFEYMTSMIIMMILIFCFSSVILMEEQLLEARSIHTSAISQLQNSYYEFDVEEFNEQLKQRHPSWQLEIEQQGSLYARREYLVTLKYDVTLPLFAIKKEGIIEGYGR